MKYKDRREQRNVSEVMESLLIPMFPFFNEKTSKLVWTALKIIRETEVENGGRKRWMI